VRRLAFRAEGEHACYYTSRAYNCNLPATPLQRGLNYRIQWLYSISGADPIYSPNDKWEKLIKNPEIVVEKAQ